MASYISPGPLCDQCKYCSVQQSLDYHSRPFEAISISPLTGIIFKCYKYSATQIADAFDKLIPAHLDFEIKSLALARWNALLPELLDGPMWRDSDFDLLDSFFVLDDFLFLRALRHRCGVKWVDRCQTGWKRGMAGWCEWAEETNQGPIQWICLVRPTARNPKQVQIILSTLMHEMCHAIFAFRCNCISCSCLLNNINGEGLTGHGPSWEKVRRAVETAANQHLKGLHHPIILCHPCEPQIEAEETKIAKRLTGLYKKVTQQGSESAELKWLERAQRKAEERESLDQSEERQLEALACAGAMFREYEHPGG